MFIYNANKSEDGEKIRNELVKNRKKRLEAQRLELFSFKGEGRE